MAAAAILIALGLGLALFGLLGDDNAPAPEDEPNELEWGDDTITGTQSDDLLLPGEADAMDQAEGVELLDGNDRAEFTGTAPLRMDGGAGDDTLISTSEGSLLIGGEGDDVLNGNTTSVLDGGAGNDHLVYAQDATLSSSDGSVQGGSGDDVIDINVLAQPGSPEVSPYFTGARVETGEGADQVNINLSLDDTRYDSEDPKLGVNQLLSAVRVVDFDPADDQLTISLSNASDSEVGALSDVTLNTRDDEIVELRLSFEAAGDKPAFSTTLQLGTNSAISLDDITIIDNRAA